MPKKPYEEAKNAKFLILGSRDVEVPGPNFVFIYIMISVNNHLKLKTKVLHLGLIELKLCQKWPFFDLEEAKTEKGHSKKQDNRWDSEKMVWIVRVNGFVVANEWPVL